MEFHIKRPPPPLSEKASFLYPWTITLYINTTAVKMDKLYWFTPLELKSLSFFTLAFIAVPEPMSAHSAKHT